MSADYPDNIDPDMEVLVEIFATAYDEDGKWDREQALRRVYAAGAADVLLNAAKNIGRRGRAIGLLRSMMATHRAEAYKDIAMLLDQWGTQIERDEQTRDED